MPMSSNDKRAQATPGSGEPPAQHESAQTAPASSEPHSPHPRHPNLHPHPQHRDRVAAVISAFRPSHDLIDHCAALAPQVAQVIVVDDGSGSASRDSESGGSVSGGDAQASNDVLAELEARGVVVLRQPHNLGIAAAMNRGFDHAATLDVEFVITFDQDSQVPDGFVDALVAEFDRASATGLRVGMVAPEFFSTTPQTRMQQDRGFLEAYAPIQSGLLMPLTVVRNLGPQRDDYFIDLVDTEYYLRARRAELEAICAPGLVLPHGFGHRLYVHLLGKRLRKRNGDPRMVAVSSPFRYYYRARNRVVLNREYGRDRGDSEVRALLRRDARNDLVLDYGVAIWSARGKLALFSLMWAGWRDGARGKLGKMPAALTRRAAKISWKHPVEG